MRIHPRKEAGIVVDFVPKARPTTTGSSRCTLCSTPTSTAKAPESRPRRGDGSSDARGASSRRCRGSSRSRRTSGAGSRVIQREWQRIDPKYLDDDEQRFWATIAGRQIRFDQRAEFARKFAEGRAGKVALEQFLATCAAENPNRRLRMTALLDRVATPVERADFDDLVTLVTQAPTWEKDRSAGVRVLLRAIGEGKPRSRRTRSWLAGPGGSRAPRARCRTAAFPRSSRRRSVCLERRRTHAGIDTRRTSIDSYRWRMRCLSPWELRSSLRPTATRRAQTPRSTARVRSSAPSATSRTRSQTTFRRRS